MENVFHTFLALGSTCIQFCGILTLINVIVKAFAQIAICNASLFAHAFVTISLECDLETEPITTFIESALL